MFVDLKPEKFHDENDIRKDAPLGALTCVFIGLLRASGRHKRRRRFCWPDDGSVSRRATGSARDEYWTSEVGEMDGGCGVIACEKHNGANIVCFLSVRQ